MTSATQAGPQRRDRAFQNEMLAIDEEFSERWLATMRSLVAEELGEPEFTIARMDALKVWTKDRKRSQARLHWKYDGTGKRRRQLVERDVDRAWRNLEQRTERLKKKPEERAAQVAAEGDRRRQRNTRINESLHAAHDTARAIHAQKSAQLRDQALGMIRQRLNLASDAVVTDQHISTFLNIAGSLMSADERELFLRTVQGGAE